MCRKLFRQWKHLRNKLSVSCVFSILLDKRKISNWLEWTDLRNYTNNIDVENEVAVKDLSENYHNDDHHDNHDYIVHYYHSRNYYSNNNKRCNYKINFEQGLEYLKL